MVGKNQMTPGQQDRTEAYKSMLVHRSTPVNFPRDPESLGSEEQLSPHSHSAFKHLQIHQSGRASRPFQTEIRVPPSQPSPPGHHIPPTLILPGQITGIHNT